MNSSSARCSLRSRFAACVAALAAPFVWCTASAQAVRRPADGFIGGVVTSARGPEAGVWVIAETTELKTPFIKIVVTDDAGRYVLPQLPTATYNVWVRGYGSRRLRQSRRASRRYGVESHGEGRELAGRGREGLSRQLLVLVAAAAREERVPRHRRERQRHPAGDGEPGALDVQLEERLQFLPPARQPDHALARSHGSLGIQDARGGVDLSHAARRARQLDGRHDGAVGLERRRARDGRLDDAHRERRAAARAAAAAAGRRAQRRRDAVGLGRRQLVHARRDHDGQERSDGQRLRARVRRVRRSRQAHGARSDRERLLRDHDSDARGRAPSAVALPAAGDAVEFLGHAASVGPREPGRSAQPDDGSQRPRLDDVEDPQRGAGVVPRRLEPQVRAVLPAQLQQSASVVLRPGDGRVPPDRHVLRDASPAIR